MTSGSVFQQLLHDRTESFQQHNHLNAPPQKSPLAFAGPSAFSRIVSSSSAMLRYPRDRRFSRRVRSHLHDAGEQGLFLSQLLISCCCLFGLLRKRATGSTQVLSKNCDRAFISHNAALTMAAAFATTNAAIAHRLGVSRLEVMAATPWTFQTACGLCHECRPRCMRAKLTRSRFAVPAT